MSYTDFPPTPRNADYEIGRRKLITVSAGALAALTLGWVPILSCKPSVDVSTECDRRSRLTWSSFITQLLPMAEQLVREEAPDEERYLRRVIALIKCVHEIPKASFSKRRVAMDLSLKRLPLVAVQIRLDPDAGFEWHAHPGFNGVLFSLGGETHVRTYDPVGPNILEEESFLIRKTGDHLLRAGDASWVSRERNNIHDVRASESGAHLLDMFTYFESGARSAYMSVATSPREPGGIVYEASWK